MVTMLVSLSLHPKNGEFSRRLRRCFIFISLHWVSTKQLTLTTSSPVKPEAVLFMEATVGQQPAGKDREENITYTGPHVSETKDGTDEVRCPMVWGAPKMIPSETVQYFATLGFPDVDRTKLHMPRNSSQRLSRFPVVSIKKKQPRAPPKDGIENKFSTFDPFKLEMEFQYEFSCCREKYFRVALDLEVIFFMTSKALVSPLQDSSGNV